MKYIKNFENMKKAYKKLTANWLDESDDNIVFKGKNFILKKNNGVSSSIFGDYSLSYQDNKHSSDGPPILKIPYLIIKNDKDIKNEDFRNIKLSPIEKNTDIIVYKQIIDNVGIGDSTYFISSFIKSDEMDKTEQFEIQYKYAPLILSAIEKSETFGDIIDNFKPIVREINKGLDFYKDVNNYNL